MAFTGDTSALRSVAGSLRALGTPGSKPQQMIAIGVGVEVRGQLREQFATGKGPSGAPWRTTKQGRPALVSKKLPQDFAAYAVSGGVAFKSRVPWLRAHHEGHTFPARNTNARTVAMSAVGNRFVSFKKLLAATRGKNVRRVVTARGSLFVRERKTRTDLLVRAVEVKSHVVKARTLFRREIYPTGTIPAPWGDAINRGADNGLAVWIRAGKPV